MAVFINSSVWFCFILKTLIQRVSWSGGGPVYEHFAWLCIYWELVHSIHLIIKWVYDPRMFRNHWNPIGFWPVVRNHWAKNIVSVHMFLESCCSGQQNRMNLCLLEVHSLNIGRLVSVCMKELHPLTGHDMMAELGNVWYQKRCGGV